MKLHSGKTEIQIKQQTLITGVSRSTYEIQNADNFITLERKHEKDA